MEKNKLKFIIVASFFSIYLLTFTSINLFKTEYDDPPFNYLTKNWLNHPIKSISLINSNKNTNIKENDNQNNLGFFNSKKTQKDINIYKSKYFSIEFDSSLKYKNFVGYYHSDINKKQCGKDSQGNDLYYPKDSSCPLNLISIENNNNLSLCDNFHLNITCEYQTLNENYTLITSNEYINGEIITQLRVNSANKKFCANSDIDLTFNDLIQNYPSQECKTDWGYDTIYKKISTDDLSSFLDDNDLLKNDIKIIKNDDIALFYRGYLGVDNLSKFTEHPVDHVTYTKTIALSKNIILFISCFYFIFYSIFFVLYEGNNKYNWTIKIIFYVYCGLFVLNFLYNAHVIFTYFRVKDIVSTVNLEGIKSYKNGLNDFIIYDILILVGITLDFCFKLYRFLSFRRNHNIINDNNNGNVNN